MKNVHKPRGTYADFKSGNFEDKIFIFQLNKNNKDNPTMTAQDTGAIVMYPLAYPIPMVGTIYDRKKGFPRKIRFVNGEESIFVDEQTPDDKFPKTKVVANFINGKITVDGQDSVKLKFFMEWDINGTKEGRDEKKEAMFSLVDTSKLVTKARVAKKARFEAEQWCFDSNIEMLLSVAETKLNSEQLAQNIEDIRYNMSLIAERNPEEFLKMLEDPKTHRRYIVNKAIKNGIIAVNSSVNAVCWSDNMNAPLTVAPAGKDAIEDFIAKSFSGDGQKYFNAISEAVDPKEAVSSHVEMPERVVVEKPVLEEIGETDVDLRILAGAAVDAGLVTINWNKTYWKYKDESFKGEAKFIQGLRDNPIMFKVLKKELAEVEAK